MAVFNKFNGPIRAALVIETQEESEQLVRTIYEFDISRGGVALSIEQEYPTFYADGGSRMTVEGWAGSASRYYGPMPHASRG